jgi:hypothetical protein
MTGISDFSSRFRGRMAVIRASAVLAVVLAGCARSSDVPADSQAAGDTTVGAALVVNEKGIGDIVAGMTVAEAEAVLKTSLAPPGADSAACRMASWPGAPAGVRLMIEGGKIVRVDVDSASVATAAGIRVGDPEDRVSQAYAGRVAVGPQKYTDGHYLTVTPAAAADSAYRLIFETDSERVTRFRSGQRPQVEYVERCG